jgi:hypothetical protein
MDLSGTILWGDGNTSPAVLQPIGGGTYSVQGINTYNGAGSFAGAAEITDQEGSSTSLTFTANVAASYSSYTSDAPLDAGSPEAISAVQGQSFGGEVAVFFDEAAADSNPADLSATINWGDGNTTPAILQPLGGGSYSVQGFNVYASPGAYNGSVSVQDAGGSSASLSFSAGVESASYAADAPLDAGSPETIDSVAGQTFAGEIGVVFDEAGANSNPADLSGTISWGEGSSSQATLVPLGGGSYSVQGTKAFAGAGSYNGMIQVNDQVGRSASLTFSANVASNGPDAPLDAGSPETISAVQGQPFSGEVGTFVDEAAGNSNPADLSGTILWGDGNSTPATIQPIGGGSYSIQGANTYLNAGSFSGTVEINDQAGSIASLSFVAGVASGSYAPDSPLDAGNPETISSTSGQAFSGEVGTFFDEAAGNSSSSDLSATIFWGDGQSSPATLQPIGGGSYSIQGATTYVNPGNYAGSIVVNDSGGSSASLTFSAGVASYSGSYDAPLDPGGPETINAVEGQAFSGEAGVFFDEAAGNSNPADLSGSITYGDGNASPATLVPLGGGSYSIQGANTYAEAGSYVGVIQIYDDQGSSASLTFETTVADAPLSTGNPESIDILLGSGYSGEVANFSDQAGAYSNPSDLSATIHWGDGSTSTGLVVPLGGGSYAVCASYGDGHTYASEGSYKGTTDVTDQAGNSLTGSDAPQFSAFVDAALSPGSPETINTTQGQTYVGEVATFLDTAGSAANPQALSATVSFGDGTSPVPATIVALGNGSYSVQASYSYASAGSYGGLVQISEQGSSGISLPFYANVVHGLEAGTPETINAVVGQAYAGEVGTFVDGAGDASNPADLSATIFWDDGETSPATLVSLDGGTYSITPASGDQHAYGKEGTYDGFVEVTDRAGNGLTGDNAVSFTAVIADAPLHAGAPASTATSEGAPATVATFF